MSRQQWERWTTSFEPETDMTPARYAMLPVTLQSDMVEGGSEDSPVLTVPTN